MLGRQREAGGAPLASIGPEEIQAAGAAAAPPMPEIPLPGLAGAGQNLKAFGVSAAQGTPGLISGAARFVPETAMRLRRGVTDEMADAIGATEVQREILHDATKKIMKATPFFAAEWQAEKLGKLDDAVMRPAEKFWAETPTAKRIQEKRSTQSTGEALLDPQRWSSAVGGAVPSLVAMGLTGGGSTAMGTLPMFMEGGSKLREEEDRERRTGEKPKDLAVATVAVVTGVVNGALERWGFENAVGHLADFLPKEARRGFLSVVAKGIQGALGEGGTEVLQQLLPNVLTKALIDSSQDLGEGVLDSLMGGIGAGGGMGTVSQASHVDKVDARKTRMDERRAWRAEDGPGTPAAPATFAEGGPGRGAVPQADLDAINEGVRSLEKPLSPSEKLEKLKLESAALDARLRSLQSEMGHPTNDPSLQAPSRIAPVPLEEPLAAQPAHQPISVDQLLGAQALRGVVKETDFRDQTAAARGRNVLAAVAGEERQRIAEAPGAALRLILGDDPAFALSPAPRAPSAAPLEAATGAMEQEGDAVAPEEKRMASTPVLDWLDTRSQEVDEDRRTLAPEEWTHDEARYFALTDSKTGLPNRLAYDVASRQDPDADVLGVDLDGLKAANDSFGHDVGDQYIEMLALEARRNGVRLFRTGGDEFQTLGAEEELRPLIEATRQGLQGKKIPVEGKTPAEYPVHKGFSYGFGRDEKSADVALYADKRARKAGSPSRSGQADQAERDGVGGRTGPEATAGPGDSRGVPPSVRGPAEDGTGEPGASRSAAAAPDVVPGKKGPARASLGHALPTTTDPARRMLLVQRVAQNMVAAWKDAPSVVVVSSEEDLPRDLQEAAREAQAAGTIEGIYTGPTQDTVYVVAEKVRTEADVNRVILHEVMGHAGVRRVIGEADFNAVMDQLAKSLPEDVAAKAEEYGLDINTPEGRRVAADEVLAEWAGANENPPGPIVRAIATVRGMLRKIFPSLKWSYDDVRALLGRARKRVETGQGGSARASEGVRFARGEGSQADKKRAPPTVRVAGDELQRGAEALSAVELLEAPPKPLRSKRVAQIAAELAARGRERLRAVGVRGGTLEESTPAGDDLLARAIAAEAEYALGSDPEHGGTWYSSKVEESLAIAALLHPEITQDPNARMAFTACMAITSQGERVSRNIVLAEGAYAEYKRTGKFPTDIAAKEAESMSGNFQALNDLIDGRGVDGARTFLATEFTVAELRDLGWDVGGENLETKVYGSAIFGPKIGQGFYQNLNGNFNPLTMDLWWMRTWGRLTGTLAGNTAPEVLAKQRARLEAAFLDDLKTVRKEPHGPALPEGQARGITAPRTAAAVSRAKLGKTTPGLRNAAKLISSAHEWDYKKHRDSFDSGRLKKPEIVYAAERFIAGLESPVEAPTSGGMRDWMRSVGTKAVTLLKEKGTGITNADLQAIEWYLEKDLYEHSGGQKADKIDFAAGMREVARRKGISDEDIDRALRSPDGRSGPGAGARETVRGGAERSGPADVRADGPEEGRGAEGGAGTQVRFSRQAAEGLPLGYERRARGRGRPLRRVDRAQVSFVYTSTAGGPEIHGLVGGRASAAAFHSHIERASLDHPKGAAVTVYPVKDYESVRLFLTPDGTAGFGLRDGDIISVFKHPSNKDPLAADAMMAVAVAEGGNRLDAFDTVLPDLYARNGFRVVARIPWDDAEKPKRWRYEDFWKFKEGRPDVVFAVYEPGYTGPYEREQGKRFETYGEAQAFQMQALSEALRAPLPAPSDPPPSTAAALKDGPRFSRRQEETPEFKEWFGDWQDPLAFSSRRKPGLRPVSQVVEEADGRPKRVYHGTSADFSEFNDHGKGWVSTPFGSNEVDRYGIFLAEDPGFASTFAAQKYQGGNVKPVYANINSPIDLTTLGGLSEAIELIGNEAVRREARGLMGSGRVTDAWSLFDGRVGLNFTAALEKEGYDGAKMIESGEFGGETVWVAMRPEQIKSATGNSGAFSRTDPDIRFSRATVERVQAELEDPGDVMEARRDPNLPAHSSEIQNHIRPYGPRETVKGLLNPVETLYQQLIRRHFAVEKAGAAMGTGTGPTHRDPGVVAELAAGHSARAEQMIVGSGGFRNGEDGNIEWTGNRSLQAVLGDLGPGRLNELRRYLVARRAIELHHRTPPQQELGATQEKTIYSGITEAAAQKEVSGAPEDIKSAAKQVTALLDDALRYWADAGGLSPAAVDVIRDMNRAYVPFYRIFEGKEPQKQGRLVLPAKRGVALQSEQAVKTIFGSQRDILDPLVAVADHIQRMVRAADLNRVGKTLVEAAALNPEGAFGLVEEVTRAGTPTEGVTNEGKALQDAAINFGVEVDDEAASALSFLSDKKLSYADDRIKVWQGGKLKEYRVAREIGESLRALGPEEATFFSKAVTFPASLLRAGVTKNPIFQLHNFLRDTADASVQTRNGFVPILDSIRGFKEALRDGSLRREWLAAGGGFATISGGGLKGAEKTIREIAPRTRTQSVLRTFIHPLEALSVFGRPFEEAARLGEFRKARLAGKTDTEAALDAARVTTNFTVHGADAKFWWLAKASAFTNPAIQGADKAFRTILEAPRGETQSAGRIGRAAAAVAVRGLLNVSLLSAVLYALNYDDKEIEELRKTKSGAVWWFMRVPGTEVILRFPKPFLWGQMFGTGMESMADKARGTDPDAMKRWRDEVLEMLTDNVFPIPTPAKMVHELTANKSLFFKRPIVPRGLEGAEPEMQVAPRTGETARQVGRAIGYSPAKIEHVVGGLGGTLAREGLKLSDSFLRDPGVSPPERHLSELPLVGRAFATGGTTGTYSIERFWREMDQVRTAKTTLREKMKSDPQGARAYAKEKATQLQAFSTYEATSERLGDLRKSIEAVRKAPDSKFTPAEKTRRIDALQARMNDVAKRTIERNLLEEKRP